MKNRIDSSRRKTPWDNNNDLTLTQLFIIDKYEKNYNFKHPKLLDTNEHLLINSIEIKKCAYCESTNIIKRGFTNNKIQRYYCKDCKKRCTPITNTIFDDHKISITEWIEFLLDIFNYSSSTLTSKVNKNSINTSIYWLHKVFLILKEYQNDIKLSGTVYLDEMFYTVIKSDLIKNNGKKLRGISKNQYCIGIAYDEKNVIAFVECMGKTTAKITKKTFINHINPESKLIHDDEKAHADLVKELNLKSESYNSLYLKTLDDKDNPLRPINHQCDLIRKFLNTHSGFDREDLQNYLNLYCFMNSKPRNKLEKVNKLLELSLSTRVTLKYRDFYKTKNKDNT